MLIRRSLAALALMVLVGLPGQAKPSERLTQTHVSMTLQTQDLGATLQSLQTLTGELGGVINNSNLQLEGGTAYANLRIPPEQVTAFLARARTLGDVQNQNVSTSDNTRSYEEARANLALAERMAAADWGPKGPVSRTDRVIFEAEFKNYLRERINSHRNNLASYDDYRRWAEISINLQSQPGQPRTRRLPPAPTQQALPSEPAVAQTPAPTPAPKPNHRAGLLIIPSIFLGVCLAYFIFSRRPPQS